MKKIYHRLAALSLAAAALSSCSRTAYTFNTQVPAYLGTARASVITTSVAPPAPTPIAVVPAAPAPAVVATAPQPTPHAATQAAVAPQPADVAGATLAVSPVPAKAAKPTLVQRLVLKKALKQLAKREARQQNTASVAQTAAAKGASVTVAIIGLAGLIVGLIINSGLLITLGSIVLVVGIVLLILSLL